MDVSGVDKRYGVIEIGPGIGVLTRELAKRAAKVVSIEVDERLPPLLAETMAGVDNFKLVMQDVLKVDLRALIAEEFPGMPVALCANLPYYITSPIVMKLLGDRLPIESLTVMVQKEAADRLAATPGTRASSAISCAVSYYATSKTVSYTHLDVYKRQGFDREAVIPVSGQTYSRKVDAFILNALAGIAQSCMKFATDLRLLANFKEMEEPFEKNQIGSSAMPYKRNPMRCERICALARYLMVDVLNPSITTGTQWFERTLDDSANKRIAMAEGFLAADAILNIMLNVTDGIVVYPKVIRSRLMAELPFMASENIMMQAVEKGGNRQELHERLRQHAIAAGKQVKEEGLPNDMVDRVAADPAFGLTKEEIVAGLVPENFVGRAPQQVDEFIAHILKPIFDANPDAVEQHASLSV